MFEDMTPVHIWEVAFFVDHLPGEPAGHMARGGCFNPESPGVLALGVKLDIKNARRIGLDFIGFENDRARAVAEDYGDIPAFGGPIDSRGLHFAAHHHDSFRFARLDQSVGKIQRVKKAAALGSEVKTGHMARIELLVEEERCSRKLVLRGERRQQDKIEIANLESGSFKGLFTGGLGKVRRHLSRLDIATLLDARALLDPFIRGVH